MAGVRHKSSLLGALILFTIARGAVSLGLPCKTEGQTCSALVSFVLVENTNVSAPTSLFQLSSYQQLLGANAWNFSLGANTGIPKGKIVKVPITCVCSNATGISQDGPKYKVQPSNTLSIIAGTIFGGLLTYFDI
ncbi:hypothetical protein SUGI_1162090 [Cryptomeria japonica]|nr:hypothetical protein SUGI_1162090 [Cryptomeria japonica]